MRKKHRPGVSARSTQAVERMTSNDPKSVRQSLVSARRDALLAHQAKVKDLNEQYYQNGSEWKRGRR